MNQSMIPEKLLDITKCNINYYKLKQKAVISSGRLDIYLTDTILCLKSQKITLEIPRNKTIVRLKEMSYCTYLHLCQTGGVYTISVFHTDPASQKLQNVLGQNLEITDWYMLNPTVELRQKIMYDCPLGQANSPELGMTNDDKLHQVGEGIGVVFGGISSLFDMSKMNKTSDEAITRFSRNSFGTETLSKWQRFKNKCSKINDQMSAALKPLSQACKSMTDDIGKNFDNSQNSFVKGVRQYSKKTEKAINEGYVKGDPRIAHNNNQNNNPNQPNNVNKPEELKDTSNERKSLL